MNKEQRMVKDWHERFEVLVQNEPAFPDLKTRDLRYKLIEEELREFEHAQDIGSIVDIADSLGDLLYVVYGAAVTYGIDMEPIFEEIHRSNMSKGDPEIVRAFNGKILKSKNWTPPDLAPILTSQLNLEKPEQ